MRKLTLIMVVVLSLVVSLPLAAMAEVGFHVGLGYNSLSNELSLETEDFQASLNTPVKMYTLDLGYDFSDKFAINAQYSWGTSDVASFETDYFGGTIEQENTNWRVEGSYKIPVGKKVKLGLVAGYAAYETTGTLNGYFYPNYYTEVSFSGSLKQSLDGAYIGPTLIYTPNDKFELGAIYRWMIDPDGKLEATIGEEADYVQFAATGGQVACSIDLEDLSSSSLELYAKAKLNECWSAKVGYTYTWIDYSIDQLEISSETGGLYAMLEYRF